MLHLVLTEITGRGNTIVITTDHTVTMADDNIGGIKGRDVHFAINARVDFVLATQIKI